MTEREFHRQRRMWALIDNVLQVAPAGDDRSHREWFHVQDWDWSSPGPVRGFLDDRGLFAYRVEGDNDFSHYGVAPAIGAHLQQFRDQLGVTDATELWFGIRPPGASSAPVSDARWAGKIYARTVGHFARRWEQEKTNRAARAQS